MPLEKLIQERIDRLESVPEKLITVIDKQEEKLFKQILKDLDGLKIVDGKIEASKDSLAKINSILENLKRTLFGSDYLNAIKEFAGEIGSQAKLNNKILEQTIGTFEDSEMFKATVERSQINALLLLDEGAVTNTLLQPIAQILTNSIVGNVSFQQAVATLRENMVGEKSLLGKYSKTIIKDAFSISDRQYNQLISKENGIEFYRYDGSRIKGSRYFCCVRKGKIFHYKEISSWGNKESLWSNPKNGGACENAHGGGRNPDTNNSTIFSYLGGYGCVDILVPIATEYVPQSVKSEAQSKGYYKPA